MGLALMPRSILLFAIVPDQKTKTAKGKRKVRIFLGALVHNQPERQIRRPTCAKVKRGAITKRRKKANLTGLSKKAITKVSASMMALRESHYWNKVHRLATAYSGNARRRSLRRSGSPRWIRIPHHQMRKAL
jgi:hypothetical protein